MKKVKALINCNGVGYENFKKGTIKSVKNDVADLLIKFNFAVLTDEEPDKPIQVNKEGD